MTQLTIVGGGGHAKVVIATARSAGYTVVRVLDDDRAKWRTQLLGVAVTGPVALADDTYVFAIGSNATRARLARSARCRFATVVHAAAVVHESVTLGEGSVVFAGAIVQPDSRIGAHAIINTAASIDHDCVLGSAVHVAPGARLAGGITVGDEAFIAAGAIVIPGIRIGARAVVGAGAVVIHDVADGDTVIGVPARSK
jgi:acetyltransferase EpsM